MMLVFAVPALLLGGLYAFLGRQTIGSGGEATVFYPALMLYNYTAEALSTAILLVAGTLVGLWVPQVPIIPKCLLLKFLLLWAKDF